MNRATPEIWELAERLLAYESAQLRSSDALTQRSFEVIEKLRLHLANLMGATGVRALVMRALALAGAEVLWLREAQVNATGSVTMPHEAAGELTAEALLEGNVMLLAQLLGLMVAFIGESLTLQLVLDVWPQVSLNDLNTRKEDP